MHSASTSENAAASLASKFINQTNRHLFLTGKAGTGKTTFLKYIVKHTHKKAVVAAPTGIAAINAGGVTLHSLFQLPFGAFVPSHEQSEAFYQGQKVNNPYTLIKSLQLNKNKRKLLNEMELLIIDEVSMLRADLLDAVDTVLRTVRKEHQQSFGGVQALFIGDLLQLPPVVKENEWQLLKDYYENIHFFEARALKENSPLYIELEKIYRQQDDQFIKVLNNLRTNQITEEDIEILNSCYRPGLRSVERENYIQLTTHNYKAGNINKKELDKLKGRSFFYKAEIKGNFSEYAYPVEETLELKKDAQVMFIKNDPTGRQRFFNGKIGKIAALDEDEIKVIFEDADEPVSVSRYEWQNIRYTVNEATNEIEESVEGVFSQFPIKLAWAITVHKSQGLTFEKAIIDICSAFAPGQVYVALSRLTSLDGLVLTAPINYSRISEDTAVKAFAGQKQAQDPLNKLLQKESADYCKNFILYSFDLAPLERFLHKHAESYVKDEKRSAKQKYMEWAKQLHLDVQEQRKIADRFLVQARQICSSERFDLAQLHSRVAAASKYFTPVFKKFSASVSAHIQEVKKESKTKKYINELLDVDARFFKQLEMINKAGALLHSAINNEELTSKHLLNDEKKERIEQFKEKKRGAKPEKGKTQQLSYEMFKEGKTIAQIAAERALAVTTIEGHLARCVASGSLRAEDFVSEEKLENIISAAQRLDTTLLGPVKQELGEEYTYSEIRFAMAQLSAMRKSQTA